MTERLYPPGTFPTIEQVQAASHEQLGRWYRFLLSADDDDRPAQALIFERFKEFGGFNPELSKKIGWTP